MIFSTTTYTYPDSWSYFGNNGSDTIYYWICPPGVYYVSVVCIGGGGAGILAPLSLGNIMGGGGGGGLGWRNSIPVIPGNTYTLQVGRAGQYPGSVGEQSPSARESAGGNSWFMNSNFVAGLGGSNSSSQLGYGVGGGYIGEGGGYGGNGGVFNGNGGGGGGAGGYSGNGGNGGNSTTDATDGSGGGGAGGSGRLTPYTPGFGLRATGGGGGIGYWGQRDSGVIETLFGGAGGRGGSMNLTKSPGVSITSFDGGSANQFDTAIPGNPPGYYGAQGGNGGTVGGGGGVSWYWGFDGGVGFGAPGLGGRGAVRIVAIKDNSGDRLFPNTNTEYLANSNVSTGFTFLGNDEQGQIDFTIPGTYTWTAPATMGVSVVAIGGGGGPGGGGPGSGGRPGGGGGGGLGWRNNIPVIAGNTYTVVVGTGGYMTGPTSGAKVATDSYFISNAVVAGLGGFNGKGLGAPTASYTPTQLAATGGAGGGFVGQGGGNGGKGGPVGFNPVTAIIAPGGGGGAGGYSGNGGAGGTIGAPVGPGPAAPPWIIVTGSGSIGAGGGGGGGAGGIFSGTPGTPTLQRTSQGAGGGGVGFLGQYENGFGGGAGGVGPSSGAQPLQGGFGGSGGNDGNPGWQYSEYFPTPFPAQPAPSVAGFGNPGGLYGGGAGGIADAPGQTPSPTAPHWTRIYGGNGAVRVMWPSRKRWFANTLTQDQPINNGGNFGFTIS